MIHNLIKFRSNDIQEFLYDLKLLLEKLNNIKNEKVNKCY